MNLSISNRWRPDWLGKTGFFARSLLVLFLLCLACKDDDYLDGFDTTQLFATPSQSELDAIKQEWQSRDLSPDGYEVEQLVEVTPSGVILKIISYKVNNSKRYAALLVPPSDVALPVRMFINGFDINNTTSAIKLQVDDAFLDAPFIFAIPALRGQSLHITLNGHEYSSPLSEGDRCDAFDGAADDVIAMLNVVELTEEVADVNRVSVRGGSRGGTVALLVGERDKRIKMAIDVAGPTNLLELTQRNKNDQTYQCQFLEALVEGSATTQEVRKRMIASSPLFFAEDLPATQLHLGQNDWIVPASQGRDLEKRMAELSNAQSFELFVYEGRGHEDIVLDNSELEDRVERLLSEL